jgi:hypothetical protein
MVIGGSGALDSWEQREQGSMRIWEYRSICGTRRTVCGIVY